MEADQSFDEDDEDDDFEEEEDVKTSKKRPASSPAIKSQVCFPPFFVLPFKLVQGQVVITLFTLIVHLIYLLEKNENGNEGGR